MTHFRSELRSAGEAYAAARYPGDLAADVLHRGEDVRSSPPRRRAALLALSALAAAAAVAFVLVRLPAARPAPHQPLRPIAQRPTLPDYPAAAAGGFMPAVSLGAFPARPFGAAPAVGRLTPPALPGGRIVPALDNPARAVPQDKPSTQESV